MKRLTKKMTLTLSFIGILISEVDCSETNLKSCTVCHGANFEKKALGKSKIVEGMNITQINTVPFEHKDSTYGSPVKGLIDISATIRTK